MRGSITFPYAPRREGYIIVVTKKCLIKFAKYLLMLNQSLISFLFFSYRKIVRINNFCAVDARTKSHSIIFADSLHFLYLLKVHASPVHATAHAVVFS